MFKIQRIVSVVEAFLLITIFISPTGFADVSEPDPFRLTIKKELIIALSGIAFQQAGNHFLSNMSLPDPVTLKRNDVIGFDRFASKYYSKKLSNYSDNTKDAATILFALTLIPDIKNINREKINALISDVAMFSEAESIIIGMTKCAKGLSERARPFAYNSNLPIEMRRQRFSFESFWSGHASLAFTTAVFTGYVYQNRHPDSKFITPVWMLGLSCATATSILRVRSGTHFPTDVIAGAAAGSFIGWLIPWMHKEKNDAVSFSTEVNGSTGFGVSYSF